MCMKGLAWGVGIMGSKSSVRVWQGFGAAGVQALGASGLSLRVLFVHSARRSERYRSGIGTVTTATTLRLTRSQSKTQALQVLAFRTQTYSFEHWLA